MFEIGDLVRIRPEWCDRPEESNRTHIVVSVNEITKRCIIEALDTGLPLAPQEVVGFEMIKKI